MELLLHIGTEKTGSSYLQTILVSSRSQLENDGIYFPKDLNYEHRMRRGEVGPGNGIEVQYAAARGDKERIHRLLSGWMCDADEKNCSRILLSTETMTAALQHENGFSTLIRACEEAGITRRNYLILIRDPVDQALSLYKHRAKFGKAPRLDTWIKENYQIDKQVKGVCRNIDADPKGSLALEPYSSDGSRLANTFFSGWLGVPVPPFDLERRINVSLTLSELELIRCSAESALEIVQPLHRRLQEIPRQLKANDTEYENWCKQIISKHLSRSREFWDELFERLVNPPSILETKVIDQNVEFSSEEPPPLRFSEAQIRAFFRVVEDSNSIKTRIRTWYRKYIRRPVGPLVKQIRRLHARLS